MDLHFSCFLCTLGVGELEATGFCLKLLLHSNQQRLDALC